MGGPWLYRIPPISTQTTSMRLEQREVVRGLRDGISELPKRKQFSNPLSPLPPPLPFVRLASFSIDQNFLFARHKGGKEVWNAADKTSAGVDAIERTGPPSSMLRVRACFFFEVEDEFFDRSAKINSKRRLE